MELKIIIGIVLIILFVLLYICNENRLEWKTTSITKQENIKNLKDIKLALETVNKELDEKILLLKGKNNLYKGSINRLKQNPLHHLTFILPNGEVASNVTFKTDIKKLKVVENFKEPLNTSYTATIRKKIDSKYQNVKVKAQILVL